MLVGHVRLRNIRVAIGCRHRGRFVCKELGFARVLAEHAIVNHGERGPFRHLVDVLRGDAGRGNEQRERTDQRASPNARHGAVSFCRRCPRAPRNRAAKSVGSDRRTTAAERQTMLRAMEAAKAALPPAPEGWQIGGYEELSVKTRTCQDDETTPWP
jgi:hypothetical protein